jgi:hypothetical protein
MITAGGAEVTGWVRRAAASGDRAQTMEAVQTMDAAQIMDGVPIMDPGLAEAEDIRITRRPPAGPCRRCRDTRGAIKSF